MIWKKNRYRKASLMPLWLLFVHIVAKHVTMLGMNMNNAVRHPHNMFPFFKWLLHWKMSKRKLRGNKIKFLLFKKNDGIVIKERVSRMLTLRSCIRKKLSLSSDADMASTILRNIFIQKFYEVVVPSIWNCHEM